MDRLSIGLSYKDKEHLEKFKQDMKYDGPISEKNDNLGCGGKAVYIQIHSNKIFNDLTRFNIVPKKSLVYTFPEFVINHSLVNHFMRGYFDGDGCISYNTAYNCPYFTIVGTEKFLYVYRDILISQCELNQNSVYSHKNDNIFSIAYGGKRNINKISAFIYKNATPNIYLKRKYDKMIFGDSNGK
ncbi:MAG: hypothetical protein WC523_00615 [Patescibacteria group bacterium]